MLNLARQQKFTVNFDEILTQEEKDQALDYAVQQRKNHFEWRWRDKGMKEGDIEFNLSQRDWISEINSEEVLNSAAIRKIRYEEQQELDKERELVEAKQRLLEKNLRDDLKSKFPASHFYKVIKEYFIANTAKKHFIYDSENSEMIKAICYFLTEDPRFETELGFNLNRGLCIMGVSGKGKTKCFEAVKGNPINPVTIMNMIAVSDQIKRNGWPEISPFVKLLLDDVGTETDSLNHFGTKINFFKEFIELYDAQERDFSKLIVTTNLDENDIQARYTYRIRSRMRETFNFVIVQGKDLRE